MAEQLASVPEEAITAGFTAPSPQCFSYRELIRSVAWPEWSIRSNLPSLSGQSGSNYSSGSSALSSHLSNKSGCSSSGLGSAGAADFCAGELTKIADRMVSDGYTKHMVEAFADGGGRDLALKNWFVELDVEWVLQIRDLKSGWGYRGSQQQVQLLPGNTSASSHRELIDKWVRAFTIIVASIKKELVAAVQQEAWAVAQFGKASISKMLVFVEPILDVFKLENLQTMLHMYICVSGASYDMYTMHSISSSKSHNISTEMGGSLVHSLISLKARSIFTGIGDLLEIEAGNLLEAISTTMKKAGTILNVDDDDDDLWATEILRGGGDVHTNTRLMVDCIVLLRKTHASMHNSSQSHTRKLSGLIQDMINYLNSLLLEKSELCLDPSLTYLFLLNNSNFVAQEVSQPSVPLDVELSSVHHPRLKLLPECEKYMDSYLDSSWGYVVSCIPQPTSLGQPKNRKKNSLLLLEFQSVFHQTYQAHKFWKVPDPQLRFLMREIITKRVIPGYCDYLKEHPELEKQVSAGSNSPEVLEEMLGELFEG